MSHRLFHEIPAFRDTVRRFRPAVFAASVLLSLASILALGVPLAVKRLAETWPAGDAWLAWLVAAAVLLLLSLALHTYGSLKGAAVSERLKTSLQRRFFDALLGQELSFHRLHGAGELVSAIYTDIQAVAGLYSRLIPSGISGLLMLAGASLALVKLSPGLALVLAGATLVSLLLSTLLLRRIRQQATELNEHSGRIYRLISEALHQVMVIRINDLSSWTVQRLKKDHEALVELSVKLQFLQGVLTMAVQLLLATALMLGWIILTRSAAEGTLGTQLSSLLFGLLLVRQLGSLAGLLGTYRQAQGAMDRLDALLNSAPVAVTGHEKPGNLETLEIKDLSFSYGDDKALGNVSFEVKRGEKIAITGPNGAGKSTLFNLIAMLEPPPTGCVLWNGSDVTRFDRRALLKKVAYLPQDSLLGQTSIADNIRMGRLEASDDEICQAVEIAGVTDIIRRHAAGLDTLLGSEGSMISGGEKRRIALARLLVRRDADLYLLDEPTDGLDREGEQSILTTVLEALDDKTVLIITHRPAVMALFDRHISLVDGRVVGDTRKTGTK